jgi:hypothetical protein
MNKINILNLTFKSDIGAIVVNNISNNPSGLRPTLPEPTSNLSGRSPTRPEAANSLSENTSKNISEN